MLYDTSDYTINDLRSLVSELETSENILDILATLSQNAGNLDDAITLQSARKIVLTEAYELAEDGYQRITQNRHPL